MTGLLQYSPYRSEQVVPAYAELGTDPIGQVVATITAYCPRGRGSSGYDWQRTAFLCADFARAKAEHVWTDDGQERRKGRACLRVDRLWDVKSSNVGAWGL